MKQKKSFIIYQNWAKTIIGLPDDLAGKLIKRICNYELGQDVADEDQTVNAIFDGYRATLDENKLKYDEVCRKRSEAGSKGNEIRWGRKCDQKIANATKKSQMIADNDTDNDIDNDVSIDTYTLTQAIGLIDDFNISSAIKPKLVEWVKYKYDRKEEYGRASLIPLIEYADKNAEKYGTDAINDLITQSITSGWKNIIWKNLLKRNNKPQTMFHHFKNTNTYDFVDLENKLLDRQ